MVFAVYHLLMVHLLTSVAKGNGESLVVSFVVVGLFFFTFIDIYYALEIIILRFLLQEGRPGGQSDTDMR